MEVLTALGRGTDAVGCIANLVRQPFGHGLFPALLGISQQPTDGQGGGPAGPHLYRDLVSGATDPAAPHFELGSGVLDRLFQDGDRIVPGLLSNVDQRVVDDALGQGPLATAQDPVDHLGDQDRVVDRVGDEFASGGGTTAGHVRTPVSYTHLTLPTNREV